MIKWLKSLFSTPKVKCVCGKYEYCKRVIHSTSSGRMYTEGILECGKVQKFIMDNKS